MICGHAIRALFMAMVCSIGYNNGWQIPMNGFAERIKAKIDAGDIENHGQASSIREWWNTQLLRRISEEVKMERKQRFENYRKKKHIAKARE